MMYLATAFKKYLYLILCIFFVLLSVTSYAERYSKCKHAPKSLIGKSMVLQVESLTSDVPENYPSKGVIVQKYSSHRLVSFQGYGDANHMDGSGLYRYRRLGKRTAMEVITDSITGITTKTRYTFTSPTSGLWERMLLSGDTKIEGSFILNRLNLPANTDFAPENQNGMTVALSVLSSESADLPEGSFPIEGSVIFQSYREGGTYEGRGFGPGTVDHHGTYQVEKVAPNVIVEETLQTIPELNFTAPFTMVYTYETPYSGIWYQNFANGLIIFSGAFTLFQSEAE